MENSHHHKQVDKTISKSKLALIVFLGVIGYFLFTEHRAHVIGFLPYLLLLACPLMHIFMHGGHGGHIHNEPQSDQEKRKGEDRA